MKNEKTLQKYLAKKKQVCYNTIVHVHQAAVDSS